MVTDLDEDGNLELIQVWDAYHPDSTNGFNAMEIWEHDPTSGEFLPQEPTATYDPPRNNTGLIRLEFQSQALDVDKDGTVELILTHRGGKNNLLSIISMTGKDFTNPQWVVEYVDSTTTTDSTTHGMKLHTMTVGDIDKDGNNDMLVQLDGDNKPIVVYSVTGANSYTRTVFDTSAYHDDYVGSAGKLAIADFDGDGNNEIYIGGRGGGKIWVVTDITSASTAFRKDNFYLIEDIGLLTESPAGKPELRGGIIGDADNDGLLSFYVTARDPVEAIYGFEWIGGAGGDVTDPDNYLMSKLYQDDNSAVTVGLVAMAIGDLDGDGMDHQDIVFTTGNGNEGTMPGIFVIEHDANVGVDSDLSTNVPATFALKQNYPNPFNPTTSIAYDLNEAGIINLTIYNISGQEVRTLVNEYQSAGDYFEIWDGSDNQRNMLTSGVYMYRLEVNGFQKTMKMLLIK